MSSTASALLLTAPVAVPLATAAGYAAGGVPAARARRAAEPPRLGPGAARAARPVSGWAGILSPAAILGCAAVLAALVPHQGPLTACGRLLRADALTVWLLLVVGAVALLACAAGPAHLAGERAAGRLTDRDARRYCVLVNAFLGAMTAALLAENLGVLWVAVEATTIVTAFLVGHRHTRPGVEAAWKYVVICSVGIALAFLGTVLVYYAARRAGISESDALDWPVLAARAGHLDPAVTRLGIGLVVLGFGAKAGLVPLHAWLPDAHSQAPAPVSALMSGVLLAVSFTALLRYKVIADSALGSGYTRALLTALALLTLGVATGLLLGQRDYKRMLAYSSMEHMSLIALGAAVGSPLALAAALLHIAGHGLAKSVAFCSAGHVLQLRGTSVIGRVRGLLAEIPVLGAAFGLAVVALLGLPPFSLFASELGIARAAFAAGGGMGWAVTIALALALTAFGALAARTAAMVLGAPPPHPPAVTPAPAGAATPAAAGPAGRAGGGPLPGPRAGAGATPAPGPVPLAPATATRTRTALACPAPDTPAPNAPVPGTAASGIAASGTAASAGPAGVSGGGASGGGASGAHPSGAHPSGAHPSGAHPSGAAGPPAGPAGPGEPVPPGPAAALPWITGLLACAALGLSTGPLTGLLTDAAAILGGR